MRLRILLLSASLAMLVFIFVIKPGQTPATNPTDSIQASEPTTQTSEPTTQIAGPTVSENMETLPAIELDGNGDGTLAQSLDEHTATAPSKTVTTRAVSNPIVITYTVRRDDTFAVIANRAHKTASQLVQLNGLKNANRLYIGQVLKLGTSTTTTTTQIVT